MSELDKVLRAAINFKEAAVDAANAESDGFEPFTKRANEILDTYIEMSKQQIKDLFENIAIDEVSDDGDLRRTLEAIGKI